ncbi:hypothetical protein [Cupriavidus pinatubonensis]|uniref:Translation initiation factor IF-2 n=1 Tax=Cupriavidus pinatubonensis TaxID=248026 RepID=A0ABN7XUN0_9BURK|nr:hypothetical protein [Cupriavidus pinatubonensis]CAG9164595.1 hypothetical protein LMG23994_00428 [Cupriavidus pinatubonensis]
MRYAGIAAIAAMALCCGTGALAQGAGNRADYGSKDSRITGPMAPGSAPEAMRKGADNPGGLGKGLNDTPQEPATGAGLPGKPNGRPASESAGKAPSTGLHGSPRKGTGGAKINQVSPPDEKAR